MTKKEIADRKLYLDTLKTQLSLDDNQAVITEMSARAKQIEAIIKALAAANINRDNIPGIDMFLKANKNPVIKRYLSDLFFFDLVGVQESITDKFIVAQGNIQSFARGSKRLVKDQETKDLFRIEFKHVADYIDAALSYYQVNDIEIIVEHDIPISKVWIRLYPSEAYQEYLQKIKFIPLKKFLKDL